MEAAIAARRSRRAYGAGGLDRATLGQLRWAAQGVTDPDRGDRSTPSAGALYPLELFVVVGEAGVDGLAPGVYHYDPDGHRVERFGGGDVRSALRSAANDQEPVDRAPIDVVVAAVDARTTGKFGDRGGRRYVPMEAGHVGENRSLQAEALGLATVSIGAFDDAAVREVVGLPEAYRPLAIYPVGRRF